MRRDPADHLATLTAEIDRCSTLARTVDHAAPLPHLPGWCVRDCLAHLVGDLRWATSIVTGRTWDPRGIVAARERDADLVAAWDAAGAAMIDAIRTAVDVLATDDPPCPNFTDRRTLDGRLSFWPRRQAHETTMHRWDLEVPTGSHHAIDADSAADAVDESLHVYTRRYGGQVLDRTIVLRCTDRDDAWRVRPAEIDGDGTRVEVDRCTGTPTGDVEGTAESLLLVVQHRLTPDEAGLRFRAHEPSARAFLDGPLVA
ncbi:MAG: maleylpyruvate isomerase family mycothiol-dependent enzyme [Acidimicrobiales bacterium]